ncbi:MAG: macro domain-containing protein [Planctomycetota bacterium]
MDDRLLNLLNGSTNPDPADAVLDRIRIVVGDITQPEPDWQIDAIVNAANPQLAGGAGVDGAIHDAAGADQLLAYNQEYHPDGVATGLAVRTPAFDLETRGIRHILHTAGPVWEHDGPPPDKLGDTREDNLLASAYMRCLDLAAEHRVTGLAFPAISTGVYGFPKPRAARIAFAHVHGTLLRADFPQHIVFVCFSDEDASHYRDAISTRHEWMLARKRL